MTTTRPIIDEAEGFIRELAAELTEVRAGECLCCYVWRQLDEYPCNDTHRHALRFRDARAPRATALKKRLSDMGACCCDCEMFMNAYELQWRFWTPRHEVEEDRVTYIADAEPPRQLPPCTAVRRGTVRPCANWVRIRRSRW